MDGELAAEADSAVALQAASSSPLSEAALRKALGALGSNSLSLQSLDFSQLDLSAGRYVRPLNARLAREDLANVSFLAPDPIRVRRQEILVMHCMHSLPFSSHWPYLPDQVCKACMDLHSYCA